MSAIPVKVGITGGIGSGKSYISKLLQRRFGIAVYDCDAEAKRLTNTSPDIRRRLEALVGQDVYDAEGLVRQRLAEYLFADATHAQAVNAIIHPVVLTDFQAWAQRQQTPVVAMESAILYESGFSTYVDSVILVDAPEEVRLQRAMSRDTATEAQIRARMRMQNTHAFRAKADYIIDNNGTATDEMLVQQLTDILKTITKH